MSKSEFMLLSLVAKKQRSRNAGRASPSPSVIAPQAAFVASVNADKVVNVLDLQAVAGHVPGGAFGYHANMDMNKDAVINVLDLQFVAARMASCP